MENNRTDMNQNEKQGDIGLSRETFIGTDALFPIDGKRKAATLEILRQEIAGKKILFVNDKTKIWKNQLHYADKSMIILHISGCIFMCLALKFMNAQKIDIGMMLTTATILSGILGFLSVLAVEKNCFAELSELSESCFFNVRQLAAFDLALSGMISLSALAACILLMGVRWQINLIRIGLYILVPFVFTQCVCLGILLTEKGRKNIWLTAAAGIFFSASCAVSTSMPFLYTQAALLFWGIALVLGTTVLGLQVRTLFTEISKGEILCTNWN